MLELCRKPRISSKEKGEGCYSVGLGYLLWVYLLFTVTISVLSSGVDCILISDVQLSLATRVVWLCKSGGCPAAGWIQAVRVVGCVGIDTARLLTILLIIANFFHAFAVKNLAKLSTK